MKLNKILLLVATMGLMLSCDKGEQEVTNFGKINFDVNSQNEVTDVTRSHISDYTTLPAGADFTISVVNSKNVEVYNGLISAYDTNTALTVDTYSVIATYGSATNEGENKPYLVGSTNFTVVGGDNQVVTIPVKLGNAVIRTAFTDTFNGYFTNYSIKLTTGNGNIFTINKGDNKAIFIDAYTLTIDATLTNQGGQSQTMKTKTYGIGSLETAHCYTITFDASNVGKGTITIQFNDTTEEVALGEVEIND